MNSSVIPVIDFEGLTKRYGEFTAVDGIGGQVQPGEIFGFLGPNGAGKTTTINMLTGLARPTSGRISFAGRDYTSDVKKAQHLMGVVPDESNLYPELTGRENLLFCAALYGMGRKEREERAAALLDEFGLLEAADKSFSKYSKGMKRRLTIAAGIIHRPAILFLDEPTTGIDVASARQVRRLIQELNAQGCTVFLTTHYIEEAERLCDRIAFLVRGRIVRTDRVADLMQGLDGRKTVQFTLNREAPALCPPLAEAFPHLACEPVSESALRVHSSGTIDLIPLIDFFKHRDREMLEARMITPSLEDVFVQVTGLESELMKNEKGGGAK